MDENGVINRLEDTALKIAKMAGVSLRLGDVMSEDDKESFQNAVRFALRRDGARQLSPQVKDLLLTPNLDFKDQIHAVMFSGGVSEFVYGYEKRNLGDLGIQLGRRVRRARINLATATFRCALGVRNSAPYPVDRRSPSTPCK